MEENQNGTQQETKTEQSAKKSRAKKVDPFIEKTDKILAIKGITPREFDKQAVLEARKTMYQEFIEENIDKLLEL